MNSCTMTGNLVKDPELRTVSSGLKVCSFSIAVKRPYKRDEVDFVDCVAWRQTAERVSKYFFKGKPILVHGSFQSRTWEKDGIKRKAWELNVDEVEFIGGEKKQNAAPAVDANPFDKDDLSGTPFEVSADELDALPL